MFDFKIFVSIVFLSFAAPKCCSNNLLTKRKLYSWRLFYQKYYKMTYGFGLFICYDAGFLNNIFVITLSTNS